jgi:hypothetical protein
VGEEVGGPLSASMATLYGSMIKFGQLDLEHGAINHGAINHMVINNLPINICPSIGVNR